MSGDELFKRYRAGLPAWDEAEREAYAEWETLDNENWLSAYEARAQDADWEIYDGPLGYDDFVADYRRADELEHYGIERQGLPDHYESALGPERSRELAWRVEDRLIGLAGAESPPTRESLSAQAKQLMAAGRALNAGLSTRVAELEENRADIGERLQVGQVEEADLEASLDPEDGLGDPKEIVPALAKLRAEQAQLRDRATSVQQELEELSTHPDHPNRWVEQHGEAFTEALAARCWFHHDRELDGEPNRVRQELPPAEPAIEAGDTGIAF